MSRKVFSMASVACLLIAAALVFSQVSDAAYTLKMVQVLHRHGARSAQPGYNETEICDVPCGYLAKEGIQMLINVGAFLRDRYNNDPAVVSTPMFPSEEFDIDVCYSRSTDVGRTLQSAESFLRGFFPSATGIYPAIHTIPEVDDIFLNSNAQPWLKFFYSYNKPLVRAACNPTTDALFPDWTVLTDMGRECDSELKCSDFETRSDCARTLFDIAVTKRAIGMLDQFPLLEEHFEKVENITRALFEYEYHYNHSDPLMLRQGGRGQPFLQQVLAYIDEAISGTNTYKLMQYSAHDTTLAPIWGTLGDRTPDGMMPPFAQVMVMELLQDDADSSYHIRVLRGAPGQSPDTNFSFSWDDTWKLQCMDAWKRSYYATDNTCPVEDFRRYVQWSAPTDPKGMCYLDDDFIAIQNCPTGGIDLGQPHQTLGKECQFYRSHCPQFSCEAGYVLNGVSLQCIRAHSLSDEDPSKTTTTTTAPTPAPYVPQTSSGVSSGAAAGIAIATFCVGAIVAAAVSVGICMCRRSGPANKYERTGM